MTDLDEGALDLASDRGRYLLVTELLTYVERYDDAADGGVPMDLLAAYVDELNERGVHAFDREELEELVETNLTDADDWAGPDAIYEVDGDLSAFPPRWHEELDGEDDVMEYVEMLAGAITEHDGDGATGGTGGGVPEQLLLDTASALGPLHRDGVRTEVERLRDEDQIEEWSDQHPESRIWPTHKETPND